MKEEARQRTLIKYSIVHCNMKNSHHPILSNFGVSEAIKNSQKRAWNDYIIIKITRVKIEVFISD